MAKCTRHRWVRMDSYGEYDGGPFGGGFDLGHPDGRLYDGAGRVIVSRNCLRCDELQAKWIDIPYTDAPACAYGETCSCPRDAEDCAYGRSAR